MTGDLRIDVLGPVLVRRDGAAIPIAGRRRRLLLALLAAERGRTLPTPRLVAALWGGATPAPLDPVNTVQQYVAALRRMLRPGDEPEDRTGTPPVIATASPGYRLDLPPGRMDLEIAADLLAVSRTLLRDGEPASARRAALRALDLWRGRPFEEFTAHPHLRGAVHRARRLQLDATEAWAAAALAAGDHAAVVALLADDPATWQAREALAVALVTALAGTGRHGHALRVAAAHRAAAGRRGAPVGPTLAAVEADAGAGRVPRPAAPAVLTPRGPGATAARLQRLAVASPVLARTGGTRQQRAEDRLAYHLALAQATNDPAVSGDRTAWLDVFDRHRDGLETSVAWATRHRPDAGVDLACELALWWDWTSRGDALRNVFTGLLSALPTDTGRPRARAATWLAYTWAAADPRRGLQYVDAAVAALREHPRDLGMARAVEAVVARGPQPGRASAAAEAAVRLLGEHGTTRELGYAHVTAALAALREGDRPRTERHVALAGELYRAIGNERGLAWLDVVESRLQQRDAASARRFHDRLGDAATGAMLRHT